MSTRTYPTDVVLSVASAINLAEDFGQVHELITELAGWPVLTHHLALDDVWDGCRAKIIAQLPWVAHAIENLPTFDDERGVAKQQVRDYVGRIVAVSGPELVLELGDPLPVLPLLAGLEHLGAGEPR